MTYVAPYTGAWIEIYQHQLRYSLDTVAPYTGAWIEIIKPMNNFEIKDVAPYTGAWIEIQKFYEFRTKLEGRSLHGSVD